MKTLLIATAALSALIAGSASAEGKFSYNIGAASDYVFRGISQTSGHGAVQGGVDYTNGIFYAGGWASNTSFAKTELDLYVGVKPTVGKTSFDFGVVHYGYTQTFANNTELKAGVSHPFGKATLGAAYFASTDYHGLDYYEVNASYPLTDALTLSGAVGEQKTPKDIANFSTGNVGLTYAIDKTWSIDARYSDTNAPKFVKDAKPRVAVLVKAAF